MITGLPSRDGTAEGPAARDHTLKLPRMDDSAHRDRIARRLCAAYIVFGIAITVVYFALPSLETPLWTVLGASSGVATIIGVRRNRPRQAIAWYLLAAAEFCFIGGDTTYFVLTDVLKQDNPFPSIADVLYLITYPLFAAAVFLMIRSRSSGRDVLSLIDALIVTTGLGLLSWVYLVIPNFQADGLTTVQRVVSVTYPLMDILILAMLARLVAGGGIRTRSMLLLALGSFGLIGADVAYGLIQLNGQWQNGGPVDAGWAVFYVAWGAAALHPSMRRLTEPAPMSSVRMGRLRVALLGLMSVIGPGVLLVGSLRHTDAHAGTVAIFSAALFVLVVLRMSGVLAAHQQSVERESALRSSSEAFVSAQHITDIYAAALESVHCLVGSQNVHTRSIFEVDEGGRIQWAAGEKYTDCGELLALWAESRSGGCLMDNGRVSVTPLRYDGADRGMLIVTARRSLSSQHHHALATLASQVALATESMRLTEHVNKARSEAQFRGMIQNASDIIVVVDDRGRITYGTPSLASGLGYPVATVLGTSLRDLLHPDDCDRADTTMAAIVTGYSPAPLTTDWRLRHAQGHYLFFEVVSSNLLDDASVTGIVFTMRDVSQRRALEQQLQHQAFHDSLTGLPNRALFQDRVESALSRCARHETALVMAMVDLDDFKMVNDTRGHAAGDALLSEVAARLQANFRSGVTIARLGGDEFALLVEDLPANADTSSFADRVMRPFARPFVVDDEEIAVSASVGLTITGGESVAADPEELLRCADLALYAAKERGKGRVQVYNDELHSRMMKRLTHRAELARGLEAGEFVLNYQPIVRIDTTEIVGSEVLVRWNHPTRGLVPPIEFIAFAEETGLIVDLGRWILDQACAQWREWTDSGIARHRLSINVSARQLEEPSFAEDALRILEKYRVPAESIVLELTESMFALDAPTISRQLTALRTAGILIAIDDFGTGYSSLSYLRRFPIDILKVDKSFVNDLGLGDSDGGALAHAIVSLAHSLHLEVVAEGIETVEQRDELQSMGCGLGQGYLYAKPLLPQALLAELGLHPCLDGASPIHRSLAVEPFTESSAYAVSADSVSAESVA